MTYFHAINELNEIHKRDERIGFISSLFAHVLLFFVGGAIFLKTAQYDVQSVPESTTVELFEDTQPLAVVEDKAPTKPVKQPVDVKMREIVKIQEITSHVLKVQANPDYFQNPPPEYPPLAKQMGQEGLVMLNVEVDREGMPIRVQIQKSSGFPLLDHAALKAVCHWRFQPGRAGDIPVETRVTIPVRFRLEA